MRERKKKKLLQFFFPFRHQVSAPPPLTTNLDLLPFFSSLTSFRYQVKKCEKPHHEVLRTLGTATRSWYDRAPAVEVRRTAPLVVAEVEIPKKKNESGTTDEDGAMRDALSRGFRQIASYIFGRNMEGEPGGASASESDPRFLDGSAMGGGSGAKIAMKSPVVTEMPLPSVPATAAPPSSSSSSVSATETAKGYVVAFVMPASKYKSAAVSLFVCLMMMTG